MEILGKIAESEASSKEAIVEELRQSQSENKSAIVQEIQKAKEETEEALNEKMDRWVYLNDLAEQIENQKE